MLSTQMGVSFLVPAYNEATICEGTAAKNITWRDGLKAIRVLIAVRLRR